MPAYVIVETDVHDPDRYERYKAASPDAVHSGGGRFVVRGGELAVLEGDWDPSRLVNEDRHGDRFLSLRHFVRLDKVSNLSP